MVLADDLRDLRVLSEAWDVPVSTLVWALTHEWVQRWRLISADLGEVRGNLKMCLEMALRDRELGPWLRREIGQGEPR